MSNFTIMVLAVVGLTIAGLAAIVVILATGESTRDGETVATIIGFLAPTIAALLAVAKVVSTDEEVKKVKRDVRELPEKVADKTVEKQQQSGG